MWRVCVPGPKIRESHSRLKGSRKLRGARRVQNWRKLQPLKEVAPLRIYFGEGMRIFLTANICKEDDFVNGMSAEIQDYDQRSQCLEVLTRTGKRLAIHIATHELEDGRRVACFPPRLGYRAKGAGHDLAACRAAAYAALSRVQKDEDYTIAGIVSPAHFVPAQ